MSPPLAGPVHTREITVATGTCKGCGKYGHLNAQGYCNVSGTLKGACTADALGDAAGTKLGEILEKWATQYVSKTTYTLIWWGLAIGVVVLYAVTR